MGDALFHADHWIDEHGEVRTGDVIDIEGGCARSEVAAGAESHHAYLVDPPLRSVIAAVAECVLNIGERNGLVSVRQTVEHVADCDSLAQEPFHGAITFVHLGHEPVCSAGAVDYHQAVGVFWEVDFHAGAVAYVVDIAGGPHGLGAVLAVVFAGAEGDGYAVLDYALVNSLSFGIEVDNLVLLDGLVVVHAGKHHHWHQQCQDR